MLHAVQNAVFLCRHCHHQIYGKSANWKVWHAKKKKSRPCWLFQCCWLFQKKKKIIIFTSTKQKLLKAKKSYERWGRGEWPLETHISQQYFQNLANIFIPEQTILHRCRANELLLFWRLAGFHVAQLIYSSTLRMCQKCSLRAIVVPLCTRLWD